MDYITENAEDEARERRRQEIIRMRKAKQLQLKRRRRMKMLLIKGGGVLVVVLLLVVSVTAFKNKPEEEFVSKIGTQEKKGWFSFGKEEENQENVEEVQEVVQSTAESTENYEAEEVKEEVEIYSFSATSETVSIWDEEIVSTNVVLIDESADTIIASKGARERISPASMTKVLTVLVAADHLTEEQLEDTFVMTREITDYGYINDCSAVGFLEGEKIPVKDLFYGTILPSGSDAAVGLATYVAGSHEAFVELMNEKLRELGLDESSHMTNCVGIYDENHYSTVYDMAVIMKAAIKNEWCKEVLSEHNYTTTVTTEHPEGINISNWFLRRIEDKETGGEVLCAKTGYVRQSKSCAVSYSTFENGKTYICVTAGSSSSWRCIYDHVDIYNQYV